MTDTPTRRPKATPMGANDPYRKIALAVILQAVRETQQGVRKAAYWLAWDGYDWLQALGEDVDHDFWMAWVERIYPEGCKQKTMRQEAQNDETITL